MLGRDFWRVYLLLGGVLLAGLVFTAALGALWIALLVLLVLVAWGLVTLAGRRRSDEPPPALPVPPLRDPAILEGRVNRMTVEEAEVPVNTGTPWEGTKLATVYVIVISGLRYTVDPLPARRGRFDWVQEGMWVRATFDRGTRTIHSMQWIPPPAG